jgi:CheY-like chemotaxis protein
MGTIQGDMDVLGLADLLQILMQHRRTGTLAVADAQSKKLIHFGSDGIMLLSSGERKGPRLGEMLLLTKQLSFPQVARALESQKQWNVHFGEAVVRLGYLPREVVFEAVLVQIEEELCDMFFWTGATFEFVEGPPPPIFEDPEQPVAILKRDVSGLILEAMRRVDEWHQYNQLLGGGQSVYALTDGIQARATEYASDPVIALIAQTLDGQRSIDEAVEDSGVSRFLVYGILARLFQDGCLQKISAPPAAASSPPPAAVPAPAKAATPAAPASAKPAPPPETPAAPAASKKPVPGSKTKVTRRTVKIAPPADAAGAESPTVLVVSTVTRTRQILCDTLRNAGYQTVGASQDTTAIDALKRRPVNLILLDSPLPPKGVRKVMAEIKQVSQTPMIVLVPSASVDNYPQLLQAGARECFAKNLPTKNFLEGLKRHLKAPAAVATPSPSPTA